MLEGDVTEGMLVNVSAKGGEIVFDSHALEAANTSPAAV